MSTIEMAGIDKRFGSVHALKKVDFTIGEAEIHALLGENGAGKTTLMRVLYGMVRPDGGRISIDGASVSIRRTRDAIQAGIGMVHQHFMLVDNMTVHENITIGFENRKGLFYDEKKVTSEIKELAARFQFDLDPYMYVSDLTVGQKQRVEIIKAVYRKSKIIILDEPTAVLTPQETDVLFGILRGLKAAGTSIVIITHKLKECLQIADRITIMRDGRVVKTDVSPGETTMQQLADYMVGRNIPLSITKRSQCVGKDAVVSVAGLGLKEGQRCLLEGIELEIKRGEILGVAGVEGNGQTELAEILSGNRRPDEGEIRVNGAAISGDVGDFFKAGVALVPEDRNSFGLAVGLSVMDNAILGYHRSKQFVWRHLFIKGAREAHAKRCLEEFDVKAPGITTTVSTLSGGNQQKMVLARVITQNPKFIICAQPTRGVDVGAINYIHNRIFEFRDKGNAVLLISADLDEVRSLSDRIVVLYCGKIVATGNADDFTESRLGSLMLGGH